MCLAEERHHRDCGYCCCAPCWCILVVITLPIELLNQEKEKRSILFCRIEILILCYQIWYTPASDAMDQYETELVCGNELVRRRAKYSLLYPRMNYNSFFARLSINIAAPCVTSWILL